MKRRAFTIIEILWTLILLGVVAAIGTQVLFRCMTAFVAERRAATITASRDSLVQHLRDDVWNCTSIKVVAVGSLVVRGGEREPEIRYAADAGAVTRSSDAGQMHWELPERVGFAAHGAAVTVHLGQEDAIALAAPRIMAGGGR